MQRSRALGLTAVAAVLWGTSFPANDLGLDDADPFTFMAVRFGIGFAGMAVAVLALGAWDAGWLRNRWVWLTAGVNALGYQIQFVGQTLTTPGKAALLVNAGNLAVPAFAYLVHRERLRGAKAPALALAAAGVLLLGTEGSLANLAGGVFLGDALALAAGLCWAAVIVLNKAAVEGRGLAALTMWVVGLTAVMSLPGALLLGAHRIGPQGLAAAGYAGLACTSLAFLLWSAGLRHVSSVTSGLVLFLEIVVALLLSLALGLERLNAWSALGALCILAAVGLASVARSASPRAAGEPA